MFFHDPCNMVNAATFQKLFQSLSHRLIRQISPNPSLLPHFKHQTIKNKSGREELERFKLSPLSQGSTPLQRAICSPEDLHGVGSCPPPVPIPHLLSLPAPAVPQACSPPVAALAMACYRGQGYRDIYL